MTRTHQTRTRIRQSARQRLSPRAVRTRLQRSVRRGRGPDLCEVQRGAVSRAPNGAPHELLADLRTLQRFLAVAKEYLTDLV